MKKLMMTFSFFMFTNFAMADLKPGQIAPNFTLQNLEGKSVSLNDFKNKIVVLEWFNKDCPFVQKHYSTKNMQNLQQKYTQKDVVWLIVNSSAKGKQGNESALDAKKTLEALEAMPTHYLIDEDGKVGTQYFAKTTPHMYVIGKDQKLLYRGAIDSIKSANIMDIPKAQNYVAEALDLTLANKEVKTKLSLAYGCNVKY